VVTAADSAPVRARAGNALALRGLRAGYGRRAVVFDVDFTAEAGKLTLLLGHNGAGKSTTLKAAAGLLRAMAGTVEVKGVDVGSFSSKRRVAEGVIYLPQEHATFGELTVRDNLRLASSMAADRTVREQRHDLVLELFPRLVERFSQRANTMSGGEQRMLAVGMTLMAGADVLLLDEPSLGMAPALVDAMLDAVQALVHDHGLSVVLVEQNLAQSLRVADHVVVMRSGVVEWDATGDEARARDDWSVLF
jgi:branched-chain amino acid transport system ATP-binding protein